VSGVTEDALLGGKVTLFQPARGFRAGLDSILLAASLPSGKQTALEIGCGCGGAVLPAAWRLQETAFTGLEIDPAMATLATRGAEANGWADRVQIEIGNARDWAQMRENTYDFVFSNPPYFEPGTSSAPGEGKTAAYTESLPLDAWIKAMLFAAKPRAPVILIHRAAELASILEPLNKQAGEITVLPIHSKPGEDAKRVLVRARKGLKRGPVKLLAGLDAAPGNKALTAIEAGGALEW